MSSRTQVPEPRSLTHGPQGRFPLSVWMSFSRHQEALDTAFETEPCSACSATGWSVEGNICATCWGTKDVPVTETEWRAGLCDQFREDIQTAIDDLTRSLASHDQQLYPDESMVQLCQRAQQAAENAAKAWRSSPDRRVVMQAVQQAGER